MRTALLTGASVDGLASSTCSRTLAGRFDRDTLLLQPQPNPAPDLLAFSNAVAVFDDPQRLQ